MALKGGSSEGVMGVQTPPPPPLRTSHVRIKVLGVLFLDDASLKSSLCILRISYRFFVFCFVVFLLQPVALYCLCAVLQLIMCPSTNNHWHWLTLSPPWRVNALPLGYSPRYIHRPEPASCPTVCQLASYIQLFFFYSPGTTKPSRLQLVDFSCMW